MSLHAYTLYSSSSGNSTCVTDGETSILIDAGYNLKHLSQAVENIGLTLSGISSVFVTHEHSDHISALTCFSKKYSAPIHAPDACAAVIKSPNVVSHPIIYEQRIGSMTVRSFPASHDSRVCVGYTVESGDEKIASVTDTGVITDAIKAAVYGCKAIIIESNYDEEMLRYGSYPYELKKRIMSRFGHLSNTACAEAICDFYSHGTTKFLLAHLSPENNEPSIALDCANKAIKSRNITDISVLAAPRFETEKLL